MTLNYVTLTLDLYDGQGNPVTSGVAYFTPSVQLTDTTNHADTIQAPVPAVFHAAGLPAVKLLATDNSAPLPAGWAWTVTFSGVPGNPAGFSFFLPFTSGSSQFLSSQTPVSTAVTQFPANPMTTAGDLIYGGASGVPQRLGIGSAGQVLEVTGGLPAWGAATGSGVTVLVPAPTGATATDTRAVTAAITSLTTALASGPATLQFQDGTYQIDSNSAVIRSPNTTTVASASNGAEPSTWVTGATGTLTVASATGFPSSGQLWLAASGNTVALISYTGTTSTTFTGCVYLSGSATGTLSTGGAVTGCLSNFAVKGTGATVISQAPNRSGLVNNTTGNIFTIADCTDFRVEGITFDGMRDTVAPLTPLTASASSGQPSVTVASGAGASYLAGQRLCVFGGLGSSDQSLNDGEVGGWGGTNLIVSSISAGGGSGGGDLITFTANLANSYTQISSTPFSDGFGPYAYAGAYISPYQTANANSVAGRSLYGEDQQNGLHLINCTRFTITRCTARNTWESPFKFGTGWSAGYDTTSLGDGCSHGSVTDCAAYHGYDQGVSLWLCSNISVTGCNLNATGWAGVSMTSSDDCTVTGNKITGCVYRVPEDQNSGSGIAVEGGKGNTITGNIITSPYQYGIILWATVLNFGMPGGSSDPSTSTFLAADTAAGTSIQVSSTTHFTVGAPYSIADHSKTEAVTIASIVDSTHVTLADNTKFSHSSGVYFAPRVPQDNLIEGNLIENPQTSSGILNVTAVRTTIQGNTIRGWNFASGTNQGINMVAGTLGANNFPTTTYLGGDGSRILGNTIGTPGATGEHGLLADSTGDLVISGNQFIGTATGSQAMLELKGVYDSLIAGNVVRDVGDSSGNGQRGIWLTTGATNSLACQRLTITGNTVTRIKNEGIYVIGGDSLTITANKVSSCGGDAGIDLQGVTNSVIADNICNSNTSAGIELENNSGTGCSNCRVSGNTCRDDGTGYNVKTGGTWTQQYGIRETGASNDNLIWGNECDSNGTAQISTAGASTYSWANVISGSPSGNFPAALIPQLADYAPTGLTGATSASRYAGATASGAPASGTFSLGDFTVDQTGAFWVCTTAGTIGSGCVFTEVSGSGGNLTNPMTTLGDSLYGGSSGSATRLAGNTTATREFLTSQGTGSAAQAPSWSALQVADLPINSSNTLGWAPADNGLLAASNDPSPLTSTGQMVSGTLYLTKLPIRSALTLTYTWWLVGTAGSITTTGSYTGLYSSSGTLLTGSADIATSFNSTNAKQLTLTTPQALSAGTFVWAALMISGSGTMPKLLIGAGPAELTMGLTAATYRFCVNGTGLTSLPGTITPSSNSTSGAFSFWAGGS